MEDGTGHAETMLGLDGVRILDVEERPLGHGGNAGAMEVVQRDRSTIRAPRRALLPRLRCPRHPATRPAA